MNKIINSLLAATLLASCSQGEPAAERSRQIHIESAIEATITTTRAAVGANDALSAVKFLRKDASTTPSSLTDATVLTGNRATNGVVSFTGGAPEYNLNNYNTYLVAYHPGNTASGSVVTWTINGQTDILLTKTVWNAGNYVTPKDGNTAPKLTFNHLLSQIEVVCKAEGGSTDITVVRAVWGKIKKIEFVAAPSTLTYNLGTLAVANGTTKANFALQSNYSGTAFAAIDMPAATNTATNAMAMLAPVPATSTYSFQLQVTTDGATTGTGDDIVKVIDVSLNNAKAAMAAGSMHKVTLTFNATAKDIGISSATIDAWIAGYTGTNDVTI